MNEYLSSASLKAMAKGQLLGKYGTLIGAYAIHIVCVLFVTFMAAIWVDTTSILGNIFYYAVSFIINLLSGLFIFGEAYIYLKLACNQKVSISDLFFGFSRNPDKIIKVQAVLTVISMVCTLPETLFSFTPESLQGNPYFLLFSVVLILLFTIINIILGLMLSQSYYLMLDFPKYTAKEALIKSRKIMAGNKGRLFYIYLSFIPLFLLGLCTCCVGFLWILPYFQATKANFYLDLMKKR